MLPQSRKLDCKCSKEIHEHRRSTRGRMTITQNLMKVEIEKVTEKFGKKNKGKQMRQFENRLEEAYSDKSYNFV